MRNRKKILHIIQSLENGGCENMLLRTLPLLSDTFEHHIITLKTPGQLAPKFKEKNIPVSTAHQKNIFDRRGYRDLLSKTKEFSPDIILTYLFHADMIGRLFLQKKISAPVIPFLRTTYNHPKYRIARLFEKSTKHLVPRYLANSSAVKNFYISEIGAPTEKITVIPNGIDVDFFDSIVPDPHLRASLHLASDDFVIICVGNLHPNKGHRYLLEAFEQISTSFSPARGEMSSPRDRGVGEKPMKLLLVGDGIERKNLEQQIESYQSKENIFFLGRRTDVPELLTISDCFVLPTLFEGMSNAIMEAMAAGLPTITTDIPENRDLVENGETGILVPTKNTKEITASIQILVSDSEKRRSYGNAARNFIQEHYSIRLSVDKLSHFLHSL